MQLNFKESMSMAVSINDAKVSQIPEFKAYLSMYNSATAWLKWACLASLGNAIIFTIVYRENIFQLMML